MRALRLHERGGPEQLRYEQAPTPFVGIGDVLIRVHAASFTPTELNWPETWLDRAGRERLPTIPAHEVSGEVVALGNGTSGASVGEEVYAITDWYRDGGAAEYVAVEARNVASKPAGIDHGAAATVPLAGLTAWEGLFRHGSLQAGQTVLIHGAGGGVCTFAVELAAAAGAKVVASGRGRGSSYSGSAPMCSSTPNEGRSRRQARSRWCSTSSAANCSPAHCDSSKRAASSSPPSIRRWPMRRASTVYEVSTSWSSRVGAASWSWQGGSTQASCGPSWVRCCRSSRDAKPSSASMREASGKDRPRRRRRAGEREGSNRLSRGLDCPRRHE